jgi:hypothetical protein
MVTMHGAGGVALRHECERLPVRLAVQWAPCARLHRTTYAGFDPPTRGCGVEMPSVKTNLPPLRWRPGKSVAGGDCAYEETRAENET